MNDSVAPFLGAEKKLLDCHDMQGTEGGEIESTPTGTRSDVTWT